MSNHHLSNAIANINLGYQHKKKSVTCGTSRLVITILKILTKIRVINNFQYMANKPHKLVINMLYLYNQPAIFRILNISKPSHRYYLSYRQIMQQFPRSRGILFYSSSEGIKTNYSLPVYENYVMNRKKKKCYQGGELLFLVQENKTIVRL